MFQLEGRVWDSGFVRHEKPIWEASYEVGYVIAREKAPYIGEKN